ncbi:UV DNA damage repair endonuclease UvsE [Tissierella sp.]|uniref:UV DNA damage repair endonuclease UvsE n=1 Tax=Tissierella sp. TaxID=41274 RepID=UPI0028AD9651|nr:UV DNA damage repair endonuclease UvsE [Tissierella sp.]
MRIGYACLTVGVLETNFKSCMVKNANEKKLLEIIEYNLKSLNNIIDYNIENNIKLFRISSDLIPFGSSPVNNIPWWEVFFSQISSIGSKIREADMRVSMHPGQYTVLNSPNEDVVLRAIEDLNYHNRILDSLGMDRESKIILHIGGVYNNKDKAIKNFVSNFQLLAQGVKERLVIENDHKSYNIGEVLEIGRTLKIPVVFDNLHNQVLPYDISKDDQYWIKECKKTWEKEDGPQKIHYSQQDKGKRTGAHSNTIEIEQFMNFIETIDDKIDIMLEVKDKNLSAVKCINSTSKSKRIKTLELEWSKYKYNILEHSHLNYNKIRGLLKNKSEYPVIEFYKLIQETLNIEETIGNTVNAVLHVWGYFKLISTEDEKKKFMKLLENYEEGKRSKDSLKKFLWKLALKYEESYLLNSYYFHL